MELRPYQKILYDQGRRAFARSKDVLLQLPTGGGKTPVVSTFAKSAIQRKRKVVAVAHRKELVDQMARTIARFGIEPCILRKGEEYREDADYYVGSIQTISRRITSGKKGKDVEIPWDAEVIIVDECHHASADSYKKLRSFYPDAYHLGVTATPWRSDNKPLSDIYTEMVAGPQIQDLIADGYLVQPRTIIRPLNADLSKAQPSGNGDYKKKELADMAMTAFSPEMIVSEYRKHLRGKQAVVFAVSREHSEAIVDAFMADGIEIEARHIDGETAEADREEYINDFREGNVKVLCNYSIITEGFDVPAIEAVILARPTLSLSLYLQMAGRALRPLEGKDEAVILDLANCTWTHGPVTEERNWTLDGLEEDFFTRYVLVDGKSGKRYTDPKYAKDEKWLGADWYVVKEAITEQHDRALHFLRYLCHKHFQGGTPENHEYYVWKQFVAKFGEGRYPSIRHIKYYYETWLKPYGHSPDFVSKQSYRFFMARQNDRSRPQRFFQQHRRRQTA